MSLYPAHRIVIGQTVALRPDGTYTLEPAQGALGSSRGPQTNAPHLAVAAVALRELAQRRERDEVARRLLRAAGVISE